MGKVVTRFVEEMICCVEVKGSVRHSEIGRSLVEEPSLKKRIDRLSRNMDRSGLTELIGKAVLAQGRDTLSKTRS
jgi:hypothetical protein